MPEGGGGNELLVDLQDADLVRANLRGANLNGAYLGNANLTKQLLELIVAGAGVWQYQCHSLNDPQNAEQGLLTTRADRQRWRPLSAGHQGEFDVAEFGQHASFLL